MKKLRRKGYGRRAAAMPSGGDDYVVNRDKQGRPLPRHMDAGSWAVLAIVERDEKVKAKETEAEKDERFRLIEVARQEKAAIKRAAKEASKVNKAAFTKS